uniref:Uncharacterized protein n=1 Tax=Anguilla anguilla TaxID=7936 RepID=A0A0E9PM91_ANGAN
MDFFEQRLDMTSFSPGEHAMTYAISVYLVLRTSV